MAEQYISQSSKPLAFDVSRLWSFALTFVVLAAAGLVVVWLGHSGLPREGDPAVLFARDMIAHHEQAVEMALAIRDRSTNVELRQLALDILLTQQAQMGQMQGWLAVWEVPLSGRQSPMAGQGTMMGMASQAEVNALQTLPIGEAETVFLQLMIRHHRGGVAMAQTVLGETDRPEVKRLATSIVGSQQSEIEYMQRLLEQWDKSSTDTLLPVPTVSAANVTH